MPVEIAVIGAQRPFVLEALKSEFEVHDLIEAPDKVAALRPVAERIRGVATNAMTGLSAEVMAVLPKVEICTIMGVGLETTNLEQARERGIVVTTTPVCTTTSRTSRVVLAMCACRRIAAADRFVRSGRWLEGRMPPAQKFSRKRAGILGLGRIGNALAPRLQGFGMTIGFYDPLPKREVPWKAYATPARAGAEQRHPVPDRRRRAGRAPHRRPARSSMRSGPRACSSTSRAAGWSTRRRWSRRCKEGRLGAAGLDVFEHEPKVPDALLGMDNVVLTPHIASNTEETMRAMGECLLDNMRSWFAGNGPVTPVA